MIDLCANVLNNFTGQVVFLESSNQYLGSDGHLCAPSAADYWFMSEWKKDHEIQRT